MDWWFVLGYYKNIREMYAELPSNWNFLFQDGHHQREITGKEVKANVS